MKAQLENQASIAEDQPRFDANPGKNGYCWWYLDAISDDRQHALTVIAFIGSVFSPYYRRARSLGPSDPENHCSINVALYGAGGKRWAMTERGHGDLVQGKDVLQVGPSSLRWDGEAIEIEINEITVPIPTRLRGKIRVVPTVFNSRQFALHKHQRHHWQPVFPGARVEVDFTDPELRWQGQGYFDTNSGGAPLEQDFNSWHWSRTHDSDGNVTVFYDRISSDLDRNCLALEIAADGCVTSVTAPPEVRLPNTGLWKIARSTRGDFGQHQPRIKTLEDTPFYARTQIEFEQSGKPVIAVHESLSMTRFTNPLVQLMLPFKMPRWASKQD